MAKKKVFQVKRIKGAQANEDEAAEAGVEESGEEKELSQTVQGHDAMDIEARFYRAAKGNADVDWIEFQPSYGGGRNLPEEMSLTFTLSSAGVLYPVWVDENYWHKTPEQEQRDAEHTGQLNIILEGAGAYPGQRVPDTDLVDMEVARETVENVLRGEYLE